MKSKKLVNFSERFPTEESCKQKFMEYRDTLITICPNCGNTEHYWKRDKEQYECKKCTTRTTIRSGTIMHASKMPYMEWFKVINVLAAGKKGMTNRAVQKIVKYRRSQPVSEMVAKIQAEYTTKNALNKLARQLGLMDVLFVTDRAKRKINKKVKLKKRVVERKRKIS